MVGWWHLHRKISHHFCFGCASLMRGEHYIISFSGFIYILCDSTSNLIWLAQSYWPPTGLLTAISFHHRFWPHQMDLSDFQYISLVVGCFLFPVKRHFNEQNFHNSIFLHFFELKYFRKVFNDLNIALRQRKELQFYENPNRMNKSTNWMGMEMNV